MPGCSYQVLPSFMELLLSLPHSSASAERQFSLLKLMKSPLRNRLKPETIRALMHVHRFIPEVDKWKIPSNVLRKAFQGRWKQSTTVQAPRTPPRKKNQLNVVICIEIDSSLHFNQVNLIFVLVISW